jgi:hypothetical protein
MVRPASSPSFNAALSLGMSLEAMNDAMSGIACCLAVRV